MSVVTIEEFIAILQAREQAMLRQVERFLILFIMECVEEIVVGGEYGPGTPVDTGYLRAMWWLDINGSGASPNLQRADANGQLSLDFGGPRAPAAPDSFPFDFGGISASILDVKPGDAVALNNNTEYAEFVEKGTSKMQPRAMVASVLNASPAIADRVAARMGFSSESFVQLKK